LLQQGVEEHHPLGRAQAGEVGVGVRRALAAVHHEQALGGKAAALHQRLHALLQRFVGSGSNLLNSGAMTWGRAPASAG
jgi:hypothetical protein